MAKEILIALTQMPEWMGNLIVAAFTVIAAGIGWLIKVLYDLRKEAKRPYKQDSERFHKVIDAVDPSAIEYFIKERWLENFKQQYCEKIIIATDKIEEIQRYSKFYVDRKLFQLEKKLWWELAKLYIDISDEISSKNDYMVAKKINCCAATTEQEEYVRKLSAAFNEKGMDALLAFREYKMYGDKLFAQKIS